MTTTDLMPVEIDRTKVLQALNINPADPRSQAVLLVCERYNLDPLLKHVQLIQGAPYITRDGYLHVAHTSSVFDGMEVVEQWETDKLCWAKVSVYRRDMSRPFTAIGKCRKNDERDPFDMALARAERKALKRAFDVSGLTFDGDVEEPEAIVDDISRQYEPPVDVIATPAAKPIEARVAEPQPTAETVNEPDEPPLPGDSEHEPFADSPTSERKPSKIDELTKPAPDPGPVADDEVLARLREKLGQLDEEQIKGFTIEWRKTQMGSVKAGAERPLLAKNSDQFDRLVESQLVKQKDVYMRRRQHVNAELKKRGISSDEARHEFIAKVTENETNSSGALLGRHVQRIIEALEALDAAEARGEEAPL